MYSYFRIASGNGQQFGIEGMRLRIPMANFVSCGSPPSANRLNCCAWLCHGTAVLAVVGGLVTTSLVSHGDLPLPVKIGVCVVSVALMASTYKCCRLSDRFTFLSSTLRHFYDRSAIIFMPTIVLSDADAAAVVATDHDDVLQMV